MPATNEDGKKSDWESTELLAKIETAYTDENLKVAWAAERAAVQSALTSMGGILPSQRYTPKSVFGVGGSGVVLQVADSLFPTVDNALKFPRPVEGKAQLVADMLAKELKFLATLRHPGIVRMLYYRTIEGVEKYGSLPFYLMEAVNGDSSMKHIAREDLTTERFLNIVQSAASTLLYLHTHPGDSFAHLDIKPDNIVIASDDRPILIDLGTCKRLDSDVAETVVACTRTIAHPALVHLLVKDPSDDNRARGMMPRSAIDPAWDLWAFGRTLLIWLGVRYDDGRFENNAFAERIQDRYVRKYLFLLCARLLSYNPPTWLLKKVGLSESFLETFPIGSADQLCSQIDRLLRSDSPLAAIPELAESATGTIQAAPGVHVSNTSRLKKTLSHRLFRRLSSITQLGYGVTIRLD